MRGLSLRNNIGLRGRRHATFFNRFLSNVLRRIASTAIFQYIANDADNNMSAIIMDAFVALYAYVGGDNAGSLFGGMAIEASSGFYVYTGIDGDTAAVDPWADWTHYFDIDSDNTQIGTDETDIIAWFDLANAPASFWTNLGQSDGDDIRVANSDGTTEYPTYVLFIDDVAETGLVASKVSSLDADAASTYRMYIGNTSNSAPGVSDALGRNAVFDWIFECAYGMFTTTNGGDDLTGNGHDATITGLTEVTANSWFSKGLDNDGTGGNRMEIPSDTALDALATFTVLWAQHKIGTTSSGEDPWGWAGSNRIRQQTGTYRDRFGGIQTTDSDADPSDVDMALALVKDGVNDEAVFFTDGTKQTVGTSQTGDGPSSTALQVMASTATSNVFIGTFSLWMLAKSELSDDHIITTQNMWADASFWTWGTIVAN